MIMKRSSIVPSLLFAAGFLPCFAQAAQEAAVVPSVHPFVALLNTPTPRGYSDYYHSLKELVGIASFVNQDEEHLLARVQSSAVRGNPTHAAFGTAVLGLAAQPDQAARFKGE